MLTAKDLLYKAMDYDGFWSSSRRMRNSKPSQCRKIQLDKLLAAFGIDKINGKAHTQIPYKTGPGETVEMLYGSSTRKHALNRVDYIKTLSNHKYYVSGEFLADMDREKSNDIIAQIITDAKRLFPEQSDFIDTKPLNLVRIFQQLYTFRYTYYSIGKPSFKRVKNEFSTEENYALNLQKECMSVMDSNFATVDELLCLLTDPEKKIFTEEQLDYPYYNFEELDEEWVNDLRKQNPF